MKSRSMTLGISIPIWSALFLLIVIGACDNNGSDEPNRNPVLSDQAFIVAIETQGQIVYADQTATLVAFANEPDRDTVSYQWMAKLLDSDKDVTGSVFNHIAEGDQRIQFTTCTSGLYSIEVKACDSRGGTDTDSCEISVIAPEFERDRSLVIIEPKDGTSVDAIVRVKGTYYEIPGDKWIAVYVRKRGSGEWISQPDTVAVLKYGLWLADVSIGNENDRYIQFDIGVTFIDIEKASEVDKTDQPKFHDMITVTRK